MSEIKQILTEDEEEALEELLQNIKKQKQNR